MVFIQIMWKRKVFSNLLALIAFAYFAQFVNAEEVQHSSTASKINQNDNAVLYGTNITHDFQISSLLIEHFQSIMGQIENEFDIFENFTLSNQDSSFLYTNSTNGTLTEIESNINKIRQLIDKFNDQDLAAANYTSEIINSLRTNFVHLQMSLGKLRPDVFIPSRIASDTIFKKSQNLFNQLDNFNQELDELEEKIEAEKATKRLLDKAVDDIKRSEILNIRALQVSMDNLQKSIDNQKRDLKEEMSRLKDEVLNLHKRNFRKEQEDINNHQLLLDVQRQQIDFRHDLEKMQKEIVQNDKEHDIRIVRDIKSSWFSEAEKALKESDNSTYRYVVGEVYDNQANNFDLLLHFAESIRDFDCKFKVYHALYSEMKNNAHCDARKLQRLGKSIKKELLDPTSTTDRELSLYDSIVEMVKKGTEWNTTKAEVAESIRSTIHSNNGTVVIADARDCFSCMLDICEEAVKKLWGTLTMVDILARAQSKLINVEEQMAFHVAIFHEIQRHNEVYITHNTIPFARHMKLIMEDANYRQASAEARSRHEEIKNKLPKSVKNLVFSKAICMRNIKVNEYLFASSDLAPNKHNYTIRYAFTRTFVTTNGVVPSNFKWGVFFVDDFKIKLRNVEYDETIYTYDHGLNNWTGPTCSIPDHARDVFLWSVPNHNCTNPNCYWAIAVHDDFIVFENADNDNAPLFADESMEIEEGRRRVFTHTSDEVDYESTNWDIMDCS